MVDAVKKALAGVCIAFVVISIDQTTLQCLFCSYASNQGSGAL